LRSKGILFIGGVAGSPQIDAESTRNPHQRRARRREGAEVRDAKGEDGTRRFGYLYETNAASCAVQQATLNDADVLHERLTGPRLASSTRQPA